MGAFVVIARDRGISIMQSGIGPVILLNLVITFTIPGIAIGAHSAASSAARRSRFVMVELDKRRIGRGNPAPFAALAASAFVVADGRLGRCSRAPSTRALADGLDAFRTLAGRVTAELEERGSRFLAIAEPVLDRAGPRRCSPARRAHIAIRRTSCPPSGCATARRSRATPASRPAAPAPRSWQRSRGRTCTTSRRSSCAGTAARTWASAASCAPTAARSREALEGAPVVRCERAADVRLRHGHEQTARRHALRDARTAGASSSTPTARAASSCASACRSRAATSLERCLRDSTRGAVTLERLGEAVLRGSRRSRAGALRAACPRAGARRGSRADRS